MGETGRAARARGSGGRLDGKLFTIVAVLIVGLGVLLVLNLWLQYVNYQSGIEAALTGNASTHHTSIVTYARAWDFAVVKTSGLFVSFVMIFTGALYVLRAGETVFKARAKVGDLKAGLWTTSPGLAMVFVGAVLAAVVVWHDSYIGFAPGNGGRAAVETSEGSSISGLDDLFVEKSPVVANEE